LKIVVDSREQAPFDFSPYPDVEVAVGTLQAGDYSLYGFAAEIAVERKSIDDLIGCLTHDRERFKRELDRLRGYSSAMIVVEAPFNAIRCGMYRSRMNPDAAVQSIFSWMQRYKIPFFFADNRADGAFATASFLRHFCRHETERYKRLQFVVGM
jgi:ERCC4-type nuclease